MPWLKKKHGKGHKDEATAYRCTWETKAVTYVGQANTWLYHSRVPGAEPRSKVCRLPCHSVLTNCQTQASMCSFTMQREKAAHVLPTLPPRLTTEA